MANRSETTQSAMLLFEFNCLPKKTTQRFLMCLGRTHLTTLHRFLSVNGKSSKKSMANRSETTVSNMLFFEVLQFSLESDATVFGVSRKAWPITAKRYDLPCFSLKFYRLPTKCDVTFFGVSRHAKNRRLVSSRKSMLNRVVSPQWFSLKFYRLSTKNDTASFGLPMPLRS